MRRGKLVASSTLAPQPCFCGCGETALWGKPGAHYRPGHAPHERAPTPPPRRVEAGAASLPYLNGGQGDLFGPAPVRKRSTA